MDLAKKLTALLFAALLAVAFAGCGGSGEDTKVIGSDDASSAESSTDDGDSDDTDSDDSESEDDSSEAQDFTVDSRFTSGEDSIGTLYTSAGALLTNPNTDLAAYGAQVLFNLVGPTGDVVDSTTETVSYIGPGETVPVAPLQIGFDLKEAPTKLEVQVVGDFVEDDGPK